MPIPILVGIGIAAAASYAAKKGYDGYQKHSEADDIITKSISLYEEQREILTEKEKITLESLTKLGELELRVGHNFQTFSELSSDLLKLLNKNRLKKLEIQLPKHKLQKIESYTYTAVGVIGSVVGAGAAGAAAGFAVYGGVMAFAAASTGTAISSLGGIAATNATLAAIGGGSLATGGLGIAGGTAILGAAVAAPVMAILGWAYDKHGDESLANANKAKKQSDLVIEKIKRAINNLQETNSSVERIQAAIVEIYKEFLGYLDSLKSISNIIAGLKNVGANEEDIDKELNKMEEKIITAIENGYALAAILTDIITTPIFKVKEADGKTVTDKDGTPDMQKDADGSMILNKEALDKAINIAKEESKSFFKA